MTITVNEKTRQIFTSSVRRKAGIRLGDELDVRVSGGIITIVPNLRGDDEYTPEQRRNIDAQLDEAEKGPCHGPFDSMEGMISHLKGELKKRAATREGSPPSIAPGQEI